VLREIAPLAPSDWDGVASVLRETYPFWTFAESPEF
jgi:hypothetical protein